ncbi:MAG: hypothetical protein J0L93_08830 [Deltaproteobacteria bacterium]|nr:hypothetical protein [Deltaproteobacteria bacterium]
MNFNDSQDLAKRTQGALASLKSASLTPSPFMKTRILAHFEEQSQKIKSRSKFWFWSFSTSGGVFSLALIAWIYLISSVTLQGVEGEELLLRYGYQTLAPQIASVEVVLPEGVNFHSRRHPHVRDLKVLKISGERVRKLGYLPVVVRSDTPGKKNIHFIFRDEGGKVLKEKHLRIQFRHKGSSASLKPMRLPT